MIEHLVKILRDPAFFNPGIQIIPTGIVWPDKNHHMLLAEKRDARAKKGKGIRP